MKRLLFLFICCLVLITTISSTAIASEIRVNLDGQYLIFDQNPVIKNGSVLVPLRKVMEALGATVNWNEENQTMIAKKDQTMVEIAVGKTDASINGSTVNIDQPPVIVNDRTLIPLRFISESLGAKVQWDSETQTVIVYSKEKAGIILEAEDNYQKGRVEQSYNKKIEYFSKAIELNPNHANAYIERCFVYNMQKLYSKALHDCNKAIEISPNLSMAYFARGVVYNNMHEYEKSMSDYNKSLELNPNNVGSLINRGAQWYNKKEYSKALDDFNRAIECYNDNAKALYWRGQTYEALGELDKAYADYEKASQLGHSGATSKIKK